MPLREWQEVQEVPRMRRYRDHRAHHSLRRCNLYVTPGGINIRLRAGYDKGVRHAEARGKARGKADGVLKLLSSRNIGQAALHSATDPGHIPANLAASGCLVRPRPARAVLAAVPCRSGAAPPGGAARCSRFGLQRIMPPGAPPRSHEGARSSSQMLD